MKILTLDELRSALGELELTDAMLELEQAVTEAARKASRTLADHLHVQHDRPEWCCKDAMLIGFGPTHAGQRCPEVLEELDGGGEWEPVEKPDTAPVESPVALLAELEEWAEGIEDDASRVPADLRERVRQSLAR